MGRSIKYIAPFLNYVMTLFPNKASAPQDSQLNVLNQERNFVIVESISLHYVMLQLTVKISRLTLEFA